MPSSQEGEPSDLRQDILDEIEDHLDCAVRIDLRESDDPQEAHRTALARFGSPTHIARRLWLDAMKGRLMNQRIFFGTNIAFIGVTLAMVGIMVLMLRQTQHMQAQLLLRIENLPNVLVPPAPVEGRTPVTTPYNRVVVRVTSEAATYDMAGTEVHLWGQPYEYGKRDGITATVGIDGEAVFERARQGEYELRIQGGPGDLRYHKTVRVFDDAENVFRIVWPDMRPLPTRFRCDLELDEELAETPKIAVIGLMRDMSSLREDGWGTFRWSPDTLIFIHPDGRQMVARFRDELYRASTPRYPDMSLWSSTEAEEKGDDDDGVPMDASSRGIPASLVDWQDDLALDARLPYRLLSIRLYPFRITEQGDLRLDGPNAVSVPADRLTVTPMPPREGEQDHTPLDLQLHLYRHIGPYHVLPGYSGPGGG